MDSKDGYCRKHQMTSNDEEWKVIIEEMTDEDGEGPIEPFEGQVCPQCFQTLRDRLSKAKRSLKIESRMAIKMRRENSQRRDVLDDVVALVKSITGKDAYELSKQEFKKRAIERIGVPGDDETEQGCLRNILPNLIAEAVNTKKKK